jgi:transglutaminase-like putative cysteine protease
MQFAQEYPSETQRAEAIFAYARDRVQYTSDSSQFGYPEFAQNADELADVVAQDGVAYGDCEDYAVLLGVMYLGAGLRSAVVLAPEHAAALVYLPDYSWANAFLTVEGERGWVWAEATGGTNPLGWAPEEFLSERLLAFELVDEGLELGDLPDKPEVAVTRHNGGSPELPGSSFFLVLFVLWLVSRVFRRRAASW